jgi:hypothetical protein
MVLGGVMFNACKIYDYLRKTKLIWFAKKYKCEGKNQQEFYLKFWSKSKRKKKKDENLCLKSQNSSKMFTLN